MNGCRAFACTVPDAMTKYLSFQDDLNMLSFVFFIMSGPENTIADRIAAILSAFLSSLERPLSALSALDPPLNPSLYNIAISYYKSDKSHNRIILHRLFCDTAGI